MNIMCSAGKGEMEVAACLACSLISKMPPCGFDYVLLKSLFGDKQDRSQEIHVTDLTGCLRKAWYDKCKPSPEYVHEKLVRWMGTAIHAHSEGTDDLVDSELPLHWDGLVGTADIVYKDGTVVDIKTSRWIFVEKLPYGSHSLQVNVYAHMLRKMSRDPKRLFIQYIDASGPTKCRKCRVPVRAFQVEGGHELKCPSCFQFVKGAHLGAVMVEVALMEPEEIEAWITTRKEDLDAALLLGLPPERETGFLCAFCASRDCCRPGDVDE